MAFIDVAGPNAEKIVAFYYSDVQNSWTIHS